MTAEHGVPESRTGDDTGYGTGDGDENLLRAWRDTLNGLYESEDAVYDAWDAAWRIVDHVMGHAWTERNLDPTRFNPYLKLGFPNDDLVTNHLRTHRLIQLSKRLYDLRDLEGYHGMIERARRDSLLGVVAELEAAAVLHRRGHRVRFKKADPTRRDYDLDATVNGVEVAVEVKAKEETGNGDILKEKSLLNTLKDARGQLPDSGPGLVFLAVPSDWVTHDPSSTMRRTISKWLYSTGRVNAVITMSEVRIHTGSEAMGFATSHFVHPNPRPRTRLRNVLNIVN